ncbi:MAG: UDP-N-acetylmuramoyl-L-alanyl-D-glutamate--2,6-diaminopimelate ligase [Oscillospiraceae bacterium]|nr:UDP-N-acetylmuramoyl-L-alanyl-D-glutamate--2,6-diaminopimelate ligase [Oscillospiraceae bacterium]
MQLKELLRAIEYTGKPDNATVTHVTEDSRLVVPGSVFCCVTGKGFDGHNFAAQALENGAVCVVAQHSLGLPCEVIVENTRAAYALLCAAYHGKAHEKLTLVGVTGTNGKTTTTCLLKQMFDHMGYKSGLIGTLVNMVGDVEYPAVLTTPDPWELHGLFAEMLATGCTHCFMEVSSQALDQKRVEGVTFQVGVFSNLTQDHLDYHGTFENYLLAKRQLFVQSEIGIVNLDDNAAPRMVKGTPARPVTYSMRRDDADYTAKEIALSPHGVIYHLVARSNIGRVDYRVPGAFSVYNSMAAACTALELGIDLPRITEALAKCVGVTGRMELVPTDTPYNVIIDYAHTPDGLENVVRAINQTRQGKLITLFGCGGDRDATKRPLMGEIAAQGSDIVVVTSDNPRSEDPQAIIDDIVAGIKSRTKLHVEPDRRAAIAYALKKAKPGDVVLLAGKGQETYQVLATGKIDFDERVIVKEILNKK